MDPEFAELYRTMFPLVFRATYLLCGSRVEAEDATQEAFARALVRWNRLRVEPWVRGWLMTTALNSARRGRRRHQTPPKPVIEDIDVDENVDLWSAVGRLARRQREAVVLYYVVDLPIGQVAAAIGCSPGSVKTHLTRAREKLAQMMKGERVDQ